MRRLHTAALVGVLLTSGCCTPEKTPARVASSRPGELRLHHDPADHRFGYGGQPAYRLVGGQVQGLTPNGTTIEIQGIDDGLGEDLIGTSLE